MNKSVLETIGYTVCVIPVVLGSWILTAYTGMCLWNWFVSKHFEIREIGLVQSLALMMVGHFFTGTWKITPNHFNKENETICNHLAASIAISLILLTAYILKGWL